MKSVGVRQLKVRASEIVEEVRAKGRRYQITRRGQPVALIVPAAEVLGGPDADELAVLDAEDKLAYARYLRSNSCYGDSHADDRWFRLECAHRDRTA